MTVCIVTGSQGRIGSAFTLRLRRAGYEVHAFDHGGRVELETKANEPVMVFHCAYSAHHIEDHVNYAMTLMSGWDEFKAIFVPSSMHIGTDTHYGRAKMMIENAARFYNGLGARIVTDRIGYFPGDGVEPDPKDPFLSHLVDGDELYARIMEQMLG